MTRIYRLAVLLAVCAACSGGSSSSPTAPPTPAATTITILGENGSSSFAPNPSSAKINTTIEWKNSDVNTHHIVSNTSGVFDTGNISAGSTSKTITVDKAGSYPYHCSIHPTMTGTLNVAE